MASLVVRTAGVEDAATLARLNGVVQRLHHEAWPDRFQAPDATRVEPALREMLAAPESRAWLCVEDHDDPEEQDEQHAHDGHDEAVGYVLAVLRERPENVFTKAVRWIELDQIAVLDDVRHRGAGRLLAGAVVEWARQSGVDVVELSVWDFNEGAQAFFGGLGFAPLTQRRCLRLPASP